VRLARQNLSSAALRNPCGAAPPCGCCAHRARALPRRPAFVVSPGRRIGADSQKLLLAESLAGPLAYKSFEAEGIPNGTMSAAVRFLSNVGRRGMPLRRGPVLRAGDAAIREVHDDSCRRA
jgi:hypothetical protein